MKFKSYITLALMLSFCDLTICNVFDTASFWISSSANFITNYYYDKYCSTYECCSNQQVPFNLSSLKFMLNTKLYGQHIAGDIVLHTIHAHLKAAKQRKPLVLSFHGANGVGKTYVSRIIAKAFFEKGENSRYFHFYYGLEDFPLIEKIPEYQIQLKNEINSAISNCERSLFVFDGVDQIPPGLLDVLMPFIDCINCGSKKKKNKAIFIFLTNTGSIAIQNQLQNKMSNGIQRESTSLQDFEHVVISEALNLKGGLLESLLIKSDAIDFYVPFLPLERHHVELCIKDAFKESNVTFTKDLIDNVIQELRFGPEPDNLFSKSGCKRVSQIVNRIAARLSPDFEDFQGLESKTEL